MVRPLLDEDTVNTGVQLPRLAAHDWRYGSVGQAARNFFAETEDPLFFAADAICAGYHDDRFAWEGGLWR